MNAVATIRLSSFWNGHDHPGVELRADRPCPGLVAGEVRRFEDHATAIAWARNQYGMDTAADLDWYGTAEVPV